MRFEYTRVDVFTDRPLTGNGLAVFAASPQLDTARMQALARELNLSESTFVIAQAPGRARVRIFTPEDELPFAGHPTLGTAAVLVGRGVPATSLILELKVGDVPVTVEPTAVGVSAELVAPTARSVPLSETSLGLAESLGLQLADLDPALPPCAWSCGNAFTYVAVRSRAEVTRSRCPSDMRPGSVGIMVFAREGDDRVHARVFCPGSGVPEDPATGSANAPLAALLHDAGMLGIGAVLTTIQGVEMGRPSLLRARMIRDADGLHPRVQGEVVWCGGGWIELPD